MFRYFTLVLCIVFAVVLATDPEAESKQRFKDAVRKCHESFPDEKDEKPRIYCISKQAKWQNEEGRINKNIIRERAIALFHDPKKQDEIYNDCTQEKATPEDTAYHILTCYQKYVHVDISA